MVVVVGVVVVVVGIVVVVVGVVVVVVGCWGSGCCFWGRWLMLLG